MILPEILLKNLLLFRYPEMFGATHISLSLLLLFLIFLLILIAIMPPSVKQIVCGARETNLDVFVVAAHALS